MAFSARDELTRLNNKCCRRCVLCIRRYGITVAHNLKCSDVMAGFVPPYALQRILAALADPTPESRTTAYIFSVLTFLVHLSFAQQDLFKGWHSRRAYERTRGQLFCALHYKSVIHPIRFLCMLAWRINLASSQGSQKT